MGEKKKLSRKTIIKIILSSILIITLFFWITDEDLKKDGKSSITFNEGSYYLAEKSGKFIELTSEGDIYEHDFNGKAKCIEKGSDIIFLEESSDAYDYESQLIIKKNGDIYVSLSHDYKGEKVGNIKGAVSGDLSENHIAIITGIGELYLYGDIIFDALRDKDLKKLDKFTKVDNIPRAKKVICESYYTLFISFSGDIFGCGEITGESYYKFRKFELPNKAVDIDSFGQSASALDSEGYIYELGYGKYNSGSNKYLEYEKLEEQGGIKAISEGWGCFVTLDNNGKINYEGTKNVGKSTGHSMSGNIRGVKNVKDIFCRDVYIYVLTDKNVYRYKLKK